MKLHHSLAVGSVAIAVAILVRRAAAGRRGRTASDETVSRWVGEGEEAFLLRRAGEERRKVAESSCVVRSVHEEMVEIYEERLHDFAAETAVLEAVVARIDRR